MKSPVCNTRPRGVLMAMPIASGMLWHTLKNSASKMPSFTGSPGSTTSSLASRRERCSLSLTSMRPWVSREAKTGTFNSRRT